MYMIIEILKMCPNLCRDTDNEELLFLQNVCYRVLERHHRYVQFMCSP